MAEKTETVYAFIDSQNLNLSVQKDIVNDAGMMIYNGWKLDFKRFFIYLKDKYKVGKAYLFIGRVPGNESLYQYLEGVGYRVIYKPTLEYRDGKERIIKGNVDAELVLHTMIEYPNFEKAIIVSGDGDYYCLVEYLAMQKKLLHVIIPNKKSYSSLLKKFRPYFVFVDDLRVKLEYRK
jgi:uncharacterized LabA/DUF88 family protein